ncbi:MAG: hypothetical protein OZ921_02005 [Sorangiineae bacterium]|nr:hypothetical protein [Polyangiaceae bacterium]MEB2321258.1 hypothetical protein [Sorangiineae bacterium]
MQTRASWSVGMLVTLLLAAGCGGSVDGAGPSGATGGSGGSGGAPGSGCVYAGTTYPVGASFPASDGCNSCSCGPGGQVSCTAMACVDGCDWQGNHYEVGDRWQADACNSCECQPNGQARCTSTPCTSCVYGGVEHEVGESFPARDGCNTCTCQPSGVSCTDMACACDPAREWWRDYIASSPSKCAAAVYTCPEHTTQFANACGCGCEQDASCPESIDCMPPAPDCDALRARCPYSSVAF